MTKSERKTGTYYVDGLSAKSNKHLYSRNLDSLRKAISLAKQWKKSNKIIQANIYYTKDILNDVHVASITLSGNTRLE